MLNPLIIVSLSSSDKFDIISFSQRSFSFFSAATHRSPSSVSERRESLRSFSSCSTETSPLPESSDITRLPREGESPAIRESFFDEIPLSPEMTERNVISCSFRFSGSPISRPKLHFCLSSSIRSIKPSPIILARRNNCAGQLFMRIIYIDIYILSIVYCFLIRYKLIYQSKTLSFRICRKKKPAKKSFS